MEVQVEFQSLIDGAVPPPKFLVRTLHGRQSVTVVWLCVLCVCVCMCVHKLVAVPNLQHFS